MTSNKKKLFRQYFFSNLTENEIKELLQLNYKEYKNLLQQTKEYYQLPSNYRRKPHRYFKYDKDSYYILKYNQNEFSIIGYYPLFEIAEKKLLEIESTENDDNNKYCIEKASDDNLQNIIEYGYITLKWNWEKLLRKSKLPYGKFYQLFNMVKKNTGLNTNRDDRYVYEVGGEYKVCKVVNGKQIVYGVYSDKEYALKVRDYLESIGWDYE